MPGPESGSIPDNVVLNLEGVECGRVGSVTGGNATGAPEAPRFLSPISAP